MSIKMNRKPSKNIKFIRPDFDSLTDLHKEAILNQDDCRKIFIDLMKDVKLPRTDDTITMIDCFGLHILPKLSDKQLNLSDVEGEYKQLIDVLTNNHPDIYPTHPGIFILMVNKIREQPGYVYAEDAKERLEIHSACSAVLKAIKDLEIPIRNKCIADFHATMTQEQWDEVRDVVRHHENPQQHGMPGNQGVPQIRM